MLFGMCANRVCPVAAGVPRARFAVCGSVLSISAWGYAVARSTGMGNARASVRGAATGKFPRFLSSVVLLCNMDY